MRNPKEPPEELPPVPRQPFPLVRTPPAGTLRGLAGPSLPALPPAAVLAPAAAQAPSADLARALEGLRVELVYFRGWLPPQLERLARVPAVHPAPAAPPPSGLGARRRALLALLGGTLFGLLLSAAAAVGWPAYGRLVAGGPGLSAPTVRR